jgi:hypothetical protein
MGSPTGAAPIAWVTLQPSPTGARSPVTNGLASQPEIHDTVSGPADGGNEFARQ